MTRIELIRIKLAVKSYRNKNSSYYDLLNDDEIAYLNEYFKGETESVLLTEQVAFLRSAPISGVAAAGPVIIPTIAAGAIQKFIELHKSKETFSTKILQYIDELGRKDSEIYKKAGMDRKHFSKLRCDKNYRPTKDTVIALSLALELDVNKTIEVLGLAGFSFSGSNERDLTILYCIQSKIYSLVDVNQVLDYQGMKAIGY